MTTASTAGSGRIRRSVRFAQLDNQNGTAKPQRQRFTEAAHLETASFPQRQDWTGSMGMSPSGRYRVIEKGETRVMPISRKGIRPDWGRTILVLLAIALIGIALFEAAAMGVSSLNIRKLNSQIASVEERNDNLRSALARSSGDISVCTEAVKMNLVSSNGVRPIPLTAPEGARMVLTETRSSMENEEIRASVTGTQGD